MKNNKIIYFIVFVLSIISSFTINYIYSKYASVFTRDITINVRKPGYKIIFNSNGPTGTTANGTMADQNFIYGISQNLTPNGYTIADYRFLNWNTEANGSGNPYMDEDNILNLTTIDNTVFNLYAIWSYIATPVVTRSDYNTFTYTASGAYAYYISKSNTIPSNGNVSDTFALDTWTTATNTGDLALASGETYYVFAKDIDGNVSNNRANIAVRTVTRTEETGSILTTKYDSASGSAFTESPVYVLDGTPINVTGSLAAGYNTLVLKKDGNVITAGDYVVNNDTNFESSAIINKLTLMIKKDGNNCTTCNGYSVNISTSATSNTATWTGTTTTDSTMNISGAMASNTQYYIWVGEDSNHKTTMKYSGVSFTGAQAATATINFYTITGALSNATYTFNGTSLANGGTVVALGSSSAIHTIAATPNTGYNFTGTIWTSSNANSQITSATTASTTFKAEAATTLTATATINKVTLTIKKDSANCTECNGYTVHISTSDSSDSASWTGSTTTASTLAINGTMAAGTQYYVWVGEDANHKSTMKYSGISFAGGATATATINFYTITISLTNSTMTFNGTSVANNGTVVALGSASAIHSIVATPTSGYGFSKWQSSSSSTTITSATEKSTTLKAGAATTLTALSYRYLVDVVSVGNYVDYPVSYSNVKGTSGIVASATGWRVLKKEGSGSNGYVVLVSAGTPLTYRVKADTSANVEAAAKKLRGTTTTGFFSVEMDKSTATYGKFHRCGISGVSSTDQLRQKFINSYTQSNPYTVNNIEVEYPVVKSITKEEVEAASGKTISHGTSFTSNNLFALATGTSGTYCPYIMATKVELNSSYYFWAIYDQGKAIETAGDQGVRPVVELKAGILTSGGSGTASSPRVMTW